jgi:hypothetical protein
MGDAVEMARLSPACDIVTTRAYIEKESRYALNLGSTKYWYTTTLTHFQHWAEKLAPPGGPSNRIWTFIRFVLP